MAKRSPELDRDKLAEAAEVCACFNFRKASRAVTQLFDQMLQQVGLRSTQFVVMVAIHLQEPVSPSALSQMLVLDRSTLSRNLKPLEQERLVRIQGGQRRQSHKISLTAKGRKLVAQAMPLWEKAQNQFVDQMGADTWSMMLRGLRAAVNATRSE